MLGGSDHLWTEPFTKAAMKRLAKEQRPGGYGSFEEAVRQIAGLMHPSQAGAFEEAVLAAAGKDPQRRGDQEHRAGPLPRSDA